MQIDYNLNDEIKSKYKYQKTTFWDMLKIINNVKIFLKKIKFEPKKVKM